MAAGLGREPWGEAEGWERPRERARAAWAAWADPGPAREPTEGVPLREVPLKAEGTGLLLPLPPACLLRTVRCWSLNSAGLRAAWEWAM